MHIYIFFSVKFVYPACRQCVPLLFQTMSVENYRVYTCYQRTDCHSSGDMPLSRPHKSCRVTAYLRSFDPSYEVTHYIEFFMLTQSG